MKAAQKLHREAMELVDASQLKEALLREWLALTVLLATEGQDCQPTVDVLLESAASLAHECEEAEIEETLRSLVRRPGSP